jgi:4-alpha-glucanotransferase
MAESKGILAELAAEYGISTEYWDWKGGLARTPDETLVAILGAFDVDATDADKARAALDERRNSRWLRTLPPCVVQTQGRPWRVFAHVPHGDWVYLTVVTKDDNYVQVPQVEHVVPPRMVQGILVGEAAFDLPPELPLGYHRLQATTERGVVQTPLVVSPHRIERPHRLGDNRAWGYAVQLYSVLSQGSWGLGDFADLADFSVWAGDQSAADYVLVNPLDAAAPTPPLEDSPYLPTSRRFLNPIYIRPEGVREYAELDGRKRGQISALKTALAKTLGDDPLIERDLVMAAKLKALRLVFAQPRRVGREVALRAFVHREGAELVRFARWCVLASEHGVDWRLWPEELRQVDSDEVAAHCAERHEEVEFHIWLQWVADAQLREAQSLALDSGMRLGLVADMPVGVSTRSAEYFSAPAIFATGVTAGAPPDFYNANGQEWGQIPWRPDKLAECAYEPFKQMLRKLMRNAGGVRIDHIMGLFRLWWVPDGMRPTQGAYVHHDHEAMVGILALEAHRSGALVVGEDLGVVEPWVRAYLAERGILGTSVVWFETWDDGTPKAAEQWRSACMASVSTHDMPPTEGYLDLAHVYLCHQLGMLSDPLEVELERAKAGQEKLLRVLRERGFLTGDETTNEEVVLALHRYLALTPAQLITASLTDAVGDRRIQNQPGTYHEYPNWRQPLADPSGAPKPLEQVFADDRAARLVEVMSESISHATGRPPG